MNVHLRLWLRRLLDQLVMVYAGPFTSVSVTGDGNKNVKVLRGRSQGPYQSKLSPSEEVVSGGRPADIQSVVPGRAPTRGRAK